MLVYPYYQATSCILTTHEIAEHGYLITLSLHWEHCSMGFVQLILKCLILEKKNTITGKSGYLPDFKYSVELLLYPNLWNPWCCCHDTGNICYGISYTGYISRKVLILPKDPRFVGKCLLASTVMAAILLYLNSVELYEILMKLIVCIIVYTGTLLALKGFTPNEIDVFKKIFSSYRNKV